MAAQIYESTVELEVEPVSLGEVDPRSAAYPYQPLVRSHTAEQKVFEVVCLENPFLIVTVVPDLGGRILSIFDKRSGVQVLPKGGWADGGPRGCHLAYGISVLADGEPRLNESGPVDVLVQSDDEGETAALWIAETSQADIGFHLRIELPADRPELLLEARFHNRRLEARHYNAGLAFAGMAGKTANGILIAWNQVAKSGLLVSSDALHHASHPDDLHITRFGGRRSMAPRQVDSWTAQVSVISGLEEVTAAGDGLALNAESSRIQVCSTTNVEGHKLVVLTEAGETLESALHLQAGSTTNFPLPDGIRAEEVAVISAQKEEVVRGRLGQTLPPVTNEKHIDEPLEQFLVTNPENRFNWKNRALAENLRGLDALKQGAFAEADSAFEQSLLYNAEDHLLWWYKAAARRHGLDEQGPELPNAHYLAPLEPALKAEAFLGQPLGHESPLLDTFKRIPHHFVEVACLLMEAGLSTDAARWLDESLRHVDLPMLRYLYAFALLEGAKLPAEAVAHVQKAENAPFGPPFPFRPVEFRALKALASRFTQYPRLQTYAGSAL
jgi:tetratricopeptide (TPR) repeat protein